MPRSAHAAPRRGHDCPGRLGAGLARHPAAERLLRRQARHPGFNESLRCELLHDKSNVRVTMVQMPAVNTPQFDWVLSRLPNPAQPVPPIYQPEVAAHGVLYAADHPGRRESGSAEARPPPSRPTRSPPACSTATWPAPGSPRSRTSGLSPSPTPSTCGNPPTGRLVTTTPRTAASTARPSHAASSCGPLSTMACWAAPSSVWPEPRSRRPWADEDAGERLAGRRASRLRRSSAATAGVLRRAVAGRPARSWRRGRRRVLGARQLAQAAMADHSVGTAARLGPAPTGSMRSAWRSWSWPIAGGDVRRWSVG